MWNRADGAVELHASGDPEALEELERWLHRGPPAARVTSVEEVVVGPESSAEGFHAIV